MEIMDGTPFLNFKHGTLCKNDTSSSLQAMEKRTNKREEIFEPKLKV